MRRIGRHKSRPYSEADIRKVRCAGCGQPAAHQWNCCANDNRWVAVCLDCDVALNEIFLAFFRMRGRVGLLARYRRKWARP